MHCADAPCVSICPLGALHTNEKGFVNYVDDSDDACIGCSLCISACPYNVPEISDGKMHKCTGCESLIFAGQEPACVDTCITNALQYGPAEELITKANERLNQIRSKYPDANLYGVTEQGGLGTLLILRTSPDEFGL
jgi:formate dehydrogenase iron-sulfur subunit